MIRTTRAARLGAALAAAALVLTACGGGDDEPATADTERATRRRPRPHPTGDGTLTIGTLLPQTGDLAFLGPPEFAGVKLAVEEINAAGGVLGQDVVNIDADSGDGTPDIAGAEVDKLFNQDVDAIIGAAASGVSVSVIDKITGAGVVHFSPGQHRRGLRHLRRQRPVLPDRAVRPAPGPGARATSRSRTASPTSPSWLARTSTVRVSPSRSRRRCEEKGATVAEFVLYAADAQNYTAEVNKIAAAKPDALVLVAFEETTKIIPQLIAKGIGPEDIQIYFVDGNLADYSDENVRPDRRQGHPPGVRRPGPGLQRPAARDRPQAEGLQLRSAVLRRRDDHRAGGHRCR